MSDDTQATVYGAAPNLSDWYYCAIVDYYGTGETDYIDGYATGAKPTVTSLREFTACPHSWVAGLMLVHSEDLDSVSAVRDVTCEKCDQVYGRPAVPTYRVLEWEVKATHNNDGTRSVIERDHSV